MSDTPASAGDLLGSAGVPLSITFRDKAHPVSPPTLAVLDRVEKLVAVRQNEAVNELDGVLPPEDVETNRQDLMAKLRAKEHRTGGKLWATEFAADGGARGLCLMLWACLEEGRKQASDPKTLPPAIAFDDIPAVLAESPDAQMVAAVLLPSFMQAVGERRKLPAAAVAEMVERYRAALAKAKGD